MCVYKLHQVAWSLVLALIGNAMLLSSLPYSFRDFPNHIDIEVSRLCQNAAILIGETEEQYGYLTQ